MIINVLDKRKNNKIRIEEHETVNILKDKLQLKVLPEYVVIKHRNSVLKDDQSVKECGLTEGSRVSLHLKVRCKMADENVAPTEMLMKYKNSNSKLVIECSNKFQISNNIRRLKYVKDGGKIREHLSVKDVIFDIHKNGERICSVKPTPRNTVKDTVKGTAKRTTKGTAKITPNETAKGNAKETAKEPAKETVKETAKEAKHVPPDRNKPAVNAGIQMPSNISLIIFNDLEERSVKEKFSIEVDPGISTDHLRKVISDELQKNLCNVDIYYKDKPLDVGRITAAGIKNHDELTLRNRKLPKDFGKQFIVKVKNLADKAAPDKSQSYLIDDFETVGALKLVLREQNNANVNCIKLYSGKVELKDADVIRELDIENGSTIGLRIEKSEKSEETKAGKIKITARNCIPDVKDRKCKDIYVSKDDTVGSLRVQLEKEFRLDSPEYIVTFGGDIMKQDNLISTYNIGEGDEVTLSGSLLVRYFMAGDNSSAKVNRYPFLPEDSVLDLKAKITRKVNIEARYLNLVYNGETLEDDMVLGESGVENESYLMMISTLAGGA